MAGSGWIPSQAWGSLYAITLLAKKQSVSPILRIALSGETHSISNVPESHLESDVRTRSGVAAADPEWQKGQLPNHLGTEDDTQSPQEAARPNSHAASSRAKTSASSRGAPSERTKMSSRTTPRQRREGRKGRGEWPCCAVHWRCACKPTHSQPGCSCMCVSLL